MTTECSMYYRNVLVLLYACGGVTRSMALAMPSASRSARDRMPVTSTAGEDTLAADRWELGVEWLVEAEGLEWSGTTKPARLPFSSASSWSSSSYSPPAPPSLASSSTKELGLTTRRGGDGESSESEPECTTRRFFFVFLRRGMREEVMCSRSRVAN